LILWAWTALLSAVVLVPVYTENGVGVIPLAVAALGLLLFTLFAPDWLDRRHGALHDAGDGTAAAAALDGTPGGEPLPGASPPGAPSRSGPLPGASPPGAPSRSGPLPGASPPGAPSPSGPLPGASPPGAPSPSG